MNLRVQLILIIIVSPYLVLTAQTSPFNEIPDYISVAANNYGTGLGVADINGDNLDDIIVANGNDMMRQHVEVYYNRGDGSFSTTPDWTSQDIDYHGQLAVGDVNGDGWNDVVVSVFLGEYRFGYPGHVKLYLNIQGELEERPSWRSADSMETFACALGDADGDGDLDLAVATGQPYPHDNVAYVTGPGRIYFNNHGILDTLPGWQSANEMCAMDVEFDDFNADGFLDLLFAGTWTPHVIYHGSRYGIDTEPYLIDTSSAWYGNSIATGYLNDDPFPDYIISENYQLGGNGKSKAYVYRTPIDSRPPLFWTSGTGGYGSAVAIEDLTGDGISDLLLGYWWGPVELYKSDGTTIPESPTWQSATGSVIETFVLRDLDNASEYDVSTTTTAGNPGTGNIVLLDHTNVESISAVYRNDILLDQPGAYVTVPGAHWVSVPNVAPGETIRIEYQVSPYRDLVVSNWDRTKGNYIFYNRDGSTGVRPGPAAKDFIVEVYPQPANGTVFFKIEGIAGIDGLLEIRDLLGRRVHRHSFDPEGRNTWLVQWETKNQDGYPVADGMYFYRIQVGSVLQTGMVSIQRQ